MHTKEYSIEIGGRQMTAIFSDLADQANGAVMLKYGETIVLATAVMSKDKMSGLGFFNLTVDYVEKFYAAGKILGSRFVRREGKPSDDAILSSRAIDRTIRPLFDQGIKHGVQVIVTVLSVDDNDPTMIAVNAASLAIATSNIPWGGPIGAIRVGKFNGPSTSLEDTRDKPLGTGDLVINPKFKEREEATTGFDLLVCGKENKINMIEAAAFQVTEDEIEQALKKTSEEISKIEGFQKKIVAELGKEKIVLEKEVISQKSVDLYNENISPKLKDTIFSSTDGLIGKKNLAILHTAWNKIAKEAHPDREDITLEDDHFDEHVNNILHEEAIKNDKRADGRKMDELRHIYAKAGGLSTIIHGSGIFYRGGTHVLSVLTLGGPEDAHFINGMETTEERKFMHHYNFPPFSAGETGRATMVNRREIGHGALAEKALAAVLPEKEKFPYTIRVVSESMASNGSTSMASVCAGSLALMDGGVPILAPVAGIAMGLMLRKAKSRAKVEGSFDSAQDEEIEYKILTDIQGPEDHHGDMDFKVAGTKNGITAIQLDVKVEGVPIFILAEALKEAKKTRMQILETIEKELVGPRKDISPNAPKILTTTIKISQIGLLIGPGGKTINGIKDKTGAEVNVEDDGTVYCTGKNGSAETALKMVMDLTHEFMPGELTKGEVVKIMDFGAFVRLNQNTDGLVHISEIAPFRVNKVSDVLKEGDIVPVKIKEIDDRGKLSLSIKLADPNYAKPRQ